MDASVLTQLTPAVEDILAERLRQVEMGYDQYHDRSLSDCDFIQILDRQNLKVIKTSMSKDGVGYEQYEIVRRFGPELEKELIQTAAIIVAWLDVLEYPTKQ